jgi:hypothetical protein
MKFIYVSDTHNKHSLMVILHKIFNNFVHEIKFHTMEFSTPWHHFSIQKV